MLPVTFFIKEWIKHANVTGIAAGNIATVSIPVGRTVHGIQLRCLTGAGVELTRAQILADVSDVTARLDGEAIITADATFLLDLQKYYGDADVAGNVDGIIPIDFAPRSLLSDEARSVYALGTAGAKSLTLDIKVVGVVQLASIEVRTLSTPEKRILGRHIKIRKYAQSFATTGEQEVNSLPLIGKTAGYRAIHISEGSGTIDQVNIKRNSVDIYDEMPTKAQQVFLANRKRTVQSGYAHADFGEADHSGAFLPMAGVQDLRVNITWNVAAGAPGNYTLYAEEVHGLVVA
ncbi:MAG: hypothetical protein KAS66_13315 [Candidatus Omnitrophica bacterium]|nr:hypothetical protein [Candidatus Omnitrophota bacterium]